MKIVPSFKVELFGPLFSHSLKFWSQIIFFVLKNVDFWRQKWFDVPMVNLKTNDHFETKIHIFFVPKLKSQLSRHKIWVVTKIWINM